ncbi:hypothetical protein GCK72_000030 [Caenorhabditis remanei]|uniref:DUF3752 domain-containing protein n=2 Tax=Caenorhabditis remanei TaxID=31234 RepID=E3MT62_CAERE|nr:hypothetical protein GCK72_000030 [Caenorhabditis remanei]EFP08605.1 hypothetical protein CRE_20405 [Caenorhabditis remanei]KAF1768218.1 hypothetical protein GCK72_000030 [Caenorhabditis remanei]
MSYGPQLPAWLAKNTDQDEESEDKDDTTPIAYGPVIPKSVEKSEKDEEEEDDEPESGVYGPAIPKNVDFSNLTTEGNEEEEEEEEDTAGSSYGPSIPSNFRQSFGPMIPGAQNDDSDDEIGPMPVTEGNEEKEALERAYRMVLQKEAEDEEKNSQPKREEWMTSVPKKMGNFGLGPRTFKKGTVSERDSSWEDAPGAKKKRRDEQKTAKSVGAAMADARQEAIVSQKTSGPSLLELHQKTREEKVKDAGYLPGERRPFDRDKDMEVRGLKAGGSKEAVEKMKELQGRFANSKDKKFL